MALATVSAAVTFAPAAQAAPPQRWLDLSRQIADPWPIAQREDGSFPDYVTLRAPGPRRNRYGEAMLGYALIQVGVRDGDGRAATAGLRSIAYALDHPGIVEEGDAGFENVALAGGYNLARERLASHPSFVAVRGLWEERLRAARTFRLGRKKYSNKQLVEAVAVLELARTGLRSTTRGTVLSDPKGAVRRVERLIDRRLPKVAETSARKNGAGGVLSLVSDPPANPLAYHALSVGFLARAVQLLGRRASSRGRAVLAEAARASWALTGPDGDLAYIGRSQQQSWALSLTSYGVEAATRLVRRGRSLTARYAALSERALARLRDAHGAGPGGVFLTPALRQDRDAAIPGLDPYVAAVPYNGLTLVGLNWALEEMVPDGRRAGAIASDRAGSFSLGGGSAAFATARTRQVWLAVKQARTGGGDLRYDFGLVALKATTGPGGAWQDVLPDRPRTEGTADSAGPALRRGGALALPVGGELRVTRRGSVSMKVGFRTVSGKWLRRGVPFVFRPLPCGVRISFPVKAGDAYDYSAFLPGRSLPPQADPAAVSDGRRTVSFSRPASVVFEGGYSSASHPQLVRARASLSAPRRETLSITTSCATSG